MSGLGEKNRDEAIQLWLTLDAAPDDDPTITITRQGVSVLTAQSMTQGASALEWYYDYTIGSAADIGAHQVRYAYIDDALPKSVFDNYDVSVASLDDIKDDTETIIANLDISAGARAVVINVKDGDTNPVEGVSVGVYNSNNDASPVFALLSTDALGDTAEINLDDDTYRVRLSKPSGIVPETETIVVTGDGTKNLTVDLFSITPPANPDVSTCYISVFKLDGTVVTSGIELMITKHDDITKDSAGSFATDTGIPMTYHAGTETWQADIWQDAHCKITSTKVLGVDDNGSLIDRDFYVGDGATTNLGAIRLS